MTLSDWINNIRWKYFTNNKAGLIFKELMKEFQGVNKMTENKRFTMEKSEGQDTIYDWEGLDDYYHLGNDTRDVKDLCDLLNEQDAEIKRLKKENRGLQFKIIDMLDFIKEKGTVTREEIKNWWNGDGE